jgi:hypothetical protein
MSIGAIVNRPRPAVASIAFVALAALLAACSASDGGPDSAPAASTTAPDAVSTSTTAAGSESGDETVAAPDMAALRGVRYCEVLLLRDGADGFTAEVWNTMGMSECPQDQWEALDAEAIAAERGAVVALLNGPRYWTLDSIDTDLRQGAPETTFGEIGMFQAATVALGDELPSQTPYTERPVARETVFGFDAGSEVYELVAPDGTTYVMQARSQIVDESLDEADLPDLGERLELPEGWVYQVRTLDEALALRSTGGVATVVQDELQNTYQRVDPA